MSYIEKVTPVDDEGPYSKSKIPTLFFSYVSQVEHTTQIILG